MISAIAFKRAMGRFCSGVTIVTFKAGLQDHGITVNAFSSLSLDPPLILICIAKSSASHQYLSNSKYFGVNILNSDQEKLCMTFANPKLLNYERFAGVEFSYDANDVAMLSGCLANISCRIHQKYDGGDHSIFIGAVLDISYSDNKEPLVYYDQTFPKLKKE